MPGKMSKRDEHLWNKAKSIVQKQNPNVAVESDKYWKLVQGVYSQSKGEKSMFSSYPMLQKAMKKQNKENKHKLRREYLSRKFKCTRIYLGKGKTLFPGYSLLEKARVKAHQRRTKSGKIVQVREHEDIRQAKQSKISIATNILRDVFFRKRYKNKVVPAKDIKTMLSSSQWHRVYGKKELLQAWKDLSDPKQYGGAYVTRKGPNWVWTG